MNAEQTLAALDSAHALRPSLMAPARQRQPVFWLALLAAAIVHVALVVGISLSEPHNLGDPAGSTQAINVELVDEGDLRSMGARQKPADIAPTPPPAQAPPPAPEAPKAEAAPEPKSAAAQKSAALPAFEAPKAQDAQPSDVVAKPAKKTEKSEEKKSEPKQEKQVKPAKQVTKPALKTPSKLDLSVPFDLTMQGAASSASASAATRPAGITRSGANDRFGRDVIRALKKTMPQSDGVTGRVKVRILLNERGNIASVRVVTGSGDRLLDDNVLFSVRQSVFPFPPKHSTVADRTFLVTYIYQ